MTEIAMGRSRNSNTAIANTVGAVDTWKEQRCQNSKMITSLLYVQGVIEHQKIMTTAV